MADQEELVGVDLLDNIASAKFQVFSRVAATKPLNYMYRLLALPPDTASQLATETGKAIDPDSDGVAFLHVSTAFQPDAFGIRIGMHVSNNEHLLAVDAALEYSWRESMDYARESEIFRLFIDVIAAPRVAASTWTILEETARSLGTTVPGPLYIPPEDIANNALQQFERKVTPEQANT